MRDLGATCEVPIKLLQKRSTIQILFKAGAFLSITIISKPFSHVHQKPEATERISASWGKHFKDGFTFDLDSSGPNQS